MRCLIVVPGALVPAPLATDLFAAAQVPRLQAWLARAQLAALEKIDAPVEGATHLHWLWRQFSKEAGTPVTAPYAWHALQQSASSAPSMATKTAAPSSTDAARLPSTAAYCWHADPVHFALARDHLLLTPLQEAEGQGLDDDTVQALLADAAPSLQAAQAQLHLCDGDWFIKRDTAWQLDCTPLAAALGAPVQSLLPQGPDAAAWRKLLTEIQIGWHHLGVNERREQQGQPVVNGLWLHGGGVYRPLNFWSLTTVYSDDPVVRGWALASGVVPHNMQALQTPLQFSRANGSTTADHLIVWPHLLVPQRLSQWHDWLRELAHLEQFLEQAVTAAWRDGVQRIEVMLTGAQSVRVVAISATDRWRIWRRNDLSTVFSEPADSSNSFSA